MQKGPDTIPINAGQKPDWQNRFLGAVAFVETLDTDDDAYEPGDILSFDSLREAFATIQSAERDLARTIPEFGSTEENAPERPEYELDTTLDEENENVSPSSISDVASTVGARLETIIEAMLFVGNRENRPLTADQIAEKLRNVTAEDVDHAVDYLNAQYQERNAPYVIVPERGGYRMVLRSEFESVRTNFYGKIREVRLSSQAIDTLAIVAYRQPITAEEIQNLRKQSCSAVLQQLVRRNLLSITREMSDKKSVVHYHTTPRFLELMQIKSLDDIPAVDELDYR